MKRVPYYTDPVSDSEVLKFYIGRHMHTVKKNVQLLSSGKVDDPAAEPNSYFVDAIVKGVEKRFLVWTFRGKILVVS